MQRVAVLPAGIRRAFSDQSESTTRAYAGGIALFLRWCARTGRHWHDGVGQFGLFITWLRHAGPQVSGLEVVPGLARAVSPHQLRHAFGSNVADAGGTIDEIQDLLGHMSMSSSQVYLDPDPARLRAAVDRVPSPRELAGMPW